MHKSLTKAQANRLLQRVYRVIDSGNIQFYLEKMQDNIGETDFGEETIKLDPRNNILQVVVHEALHILYPVVTYDIDGGECSSYVTHLEEELAEHMSDTQWRNLFKRISFALNRNIR